MSSYVLMCGDWPLVAAELCTGAARPPRWDAKCRMGSGLRPRLRFVLSGGQQRNATPPRQPMNPAYAPYVPQLGDTSAARRRTALAVDAGGSNFRRRRCERSQQGVIGRSVMLE